MAVHVWSLFLCLVVCGNTFASFNPTVTVKSCSQAKIVVTLTDASDGGIVYVQGQGSACKQITTRTEKEHEFDYQACNIKFEAQFRLVVQKKALYQTGDDRVIPVMCMVDTSDIVVSAGMNVNDKEADGGQNVTVKATGQMKLLRAGVDVTGGDVKLSDIITMDISLHDNFKTDFDISARECTASTIPIMGEFCAKDVELFPNFEHPTRGVIKSQFGVFRPTDLAGGRVAITFSCTLKICREDCEPQTCPNEQDGWGRKRRAIEKRDTTTLSEEDITVGTTLLILADDVIIEGTDVNDEVCINSLAFVIVMVILIAALIASCASSAVLLKRLYLRTDQLSGLESNKKVYETPGKLKIPFGVDVEKEKSCSDREVTDTT